MKRLSIQVRLAAWYFVSVAAIVALFAAGSWFALRASMYHSIDRDLQYRMRAVVPFIESHALNSQEQFARAFAASSDASIVGVFVQITNERQATIYASDVLVSHRVPALPQGAPDGSVTVSTQGESGWPVRVASQRVVVEGVVLTVHVVEPLRDMLGSLREYTLYFSFLIPLALLLTTTVGYWMSRRALAPVEQIRKQAEAIAPADLATRLQVPETDDELARLAQTLNAMLERIEAGFRSVEQFTADASHELRAPLALIITAGDVSLRRERSRDELADALRKIVREARRMSKLVEDLLALARGQGQGKGQGPAPELIPVDMGLLLRELCVELAPAAQAKGLRLSAAIPDEEIQDKICVMGESAELRRLFLILIDNAIKYTEAGSIDVGLQSDDSGVAAMVRDTGIGIEEAALPHVFDRFWRADKVRSRAEGGAGLGLAIALQIAQRYGGQISVESAMGRGSTFTVRFTSLLTVGPQAVRLSD